MGVGSCISKYLGNRLFLMEMLHGFPFGSYLIYMTKEIVNLLFPISRCKKPEPPAAIGKCCIFTRTDL